VNGPTITVKAKSNSRAENSNFVRPFTDALRATFVRNQAIAASIWALWVEKLINIKRMIFSASLKFVGTDAIVALGAIAVETEYLETGRIPVRFEPLEHLAGLPNFAAMFCSITIDMVYGQKLKMGLSATGAFQGAIGIMKQCFKPSTSIVFNGSFLSFLWVLLPPLFRAFFDTFFAVGAVAHRAIVSRPSSVKLGDRLDFSTDRAAFCIHRANIAQYAESVKEVYFGVR